MNCSTNSIYSDFNDIEFIRSNYVQPPRKEGDVIQNHIPIAIYEDDAAFAKRLARIVTTYTHHLPALHTASVFEMECFVQNATTSALYFLDIVDERTSKTVGLYLADLIHDQGRSDLVSFITAYPEQILYDSQRKTRCFNTILKHSAKLQREITTTIAMAQDILAGCCLCLAHEGRFENLYIAHARILFIEAVKRSGKVCIHCTDGQYTINSTLTALFAELRNAGFAHCHRSFIVNTAHIVGTDKPHKLLRLKGGEVCPYSALFFNPNLTERGRGDG